MATTTYETLRDAQISSIEGITPSLMSSVPFRANLAEIDFRAWADANPQSALRRFSVVDLFEDEPVEVSNLDVENRFGRGEIVVAYPRNYRYGSDNHRDMTDVIRSDRIALVNEAGYRGHANFTNATVYETVNRIERGEANDFVVLDYAYAFWENVQ